jgi:hypothetical protein
MDTKNPLAKLIGNWRSVAVMDPPSSGYFRITPDLKFFAAQPMPPNSKGTIHYCNFRMLAENITDSTFTLRFDGKDGGSEHRYFFDDEVLVLMTTSAELRWNCCRIGEEELPDYFEPEFAKAMEKPWV